MIHDKKPDGQDKVYYDGFFFVKTWQGEPKIGEPEKCDELRWFDINNLPEQIIPDRRVVIKNFINGITYSEMGWNLA